MKEHRILVYYRRSILAHAFARRYSIDMLYAGVTGLDAKPSLSQPPPAVRV